MQAIYLTLEAETQIGVRVQPCVAFRVMLRAV